MPAPLVPTVGLGVLHLFCTAGPLADGEAVAAAVKAAEADDVQVVTVAMLGHKADLAIMALGADLWRLRRLQTDLAAAGLEVVDSYVSLTELSEYAQGVPEELRQARLHPQLPPEGKTAFCFYPMSKRRGDVSNWFTLPYDDRKDLMHAHGASGRKFAGRVLQVVTGSTGIDDFEWGVTLFAVHPDDLKEVVYTMRFDEASARYAEFGPFYTGMVASLGEVLEAVGLDSHAVTTPQHSRLYVWPIVAPDRCTHRLLGALVLGGMVLVAGLSGTAAAQDEGTGSEREITVLVVDRQGTRDRGDDEPVEGARITVTDPSDEVVDEVETDEEGRATITLPDEGAYTASLDLDSLPDDAGLPREGGDVVELGRSRVLNIVVGDRERAATTTIDRLPQLIFNGLSFGLIIVICSVGLSLIYGTTGLVNFSHGELVTWGAMVAWWMNADHGLALLPAALIAILVGAATGALVDKLLWGRLRSRGMSLVAMMIVSIGLSLAARSVFQLVFGGVYRPYHQYNVQQGIDIGPITTSPKDVWIIGIVLLVIVGVASLLQYSRIGKAMRAVSDNPDLAASSGIDVEQVILFVWALGAGLAALGGILFGIQQQVQFEMGFKLLLLMFAGITLGGLGTAYGALVGSVVVGLFVELSTLFIPTELKSVGALAILIVVLLFRPQGILGTPERVG